MVRMMLIIGMFQVVRDDAREISGQYATGYMKKLNASKPLNVQLLKSQSR